MSSVGFGITSYGSAIDAQLDRKLNGKAGWDAGGYLYGE
jgi:hypothetical protein